jgi:predicted MFS family arabinose efflux permease
MSLDMPTRQSFVPSLVPKPDLPSAVALNSSMFNAARALGPALSGYLLARHVSLADCFFLNAVSYIAVLIGIFMMRGDGLGDPPPHEGPRENVFDNLRAGFHYVKNDHTALNLILLVGGFGTFAFSFNVLIPTFVKYTLLAHATEAAQIHAFGMLETIRGLGALVGAISVAVFASAGKQKFQLIAGSLIATLVLVVFAFARDMTVAYITMAIVSFGFVLCFATCNTLMQMTVPDDLRGRVMAIYMLMFIGTGPIGSLLAGFMAAREGAPHTILFFALISLAIAVYACFRPNGIRAIRTQGKPPAQQETCAEPFTEPGPEPRMAGGS